MYIPFDSVFTINSSSRSNGFGYDLKYKFVDGTSPDIFNPTDGNFGFGTAIFTNAYAGFKWNKHHYIDFGFLYRPFNQISLGATSHFDDKFETYHQSTFGIALRPFFQHRLTVGADMVILENDSTFLYPHLTVEPVDGILLSLRSNADFDDYQINLAFNLGKETIYSPSSYNAANEYTGGIGYYTDTKQQKSIFNKKTKGTKHFVRMKLSGLFIEEKPYESKFSFNI